MEDASFFFPGPPVGSREQFTAPDREVARTIIFDDNTTISKSKDDLNKCGSHQ